ncbi:MFS transporter [Paracoccus spongiarum]|uniref:MFS transporter n=1 Tax=Paracoccus spongiarum TaxID=3064387 RepID=A0ABT9JGH3_9RHOB|nr:MFS transporter [Paracoccus sp. 2205BS29-5]MDP5308902.1 MFS transporter [Paracoccus sp. 2205BS29-5]
MADDALPRGQVAAYGAMALPLAFGGLPLYVHAPDFYAASHAVPLAVLGVALGWLRLLDAVLDPLAGWAGDRWPARRGAMVAAGALLLGVGVASLFSTPALPVLVWFALAMALASLGHSLISVNLLTLGGLWRRAPAEKARISALREGFGLAGLILAVVLPSALAPVIGRQGALLVMAGLLIVALAITLPVFLRWRREARLDLRARPDQRPDWRALLPFYAVALLVLLSAAFPAALILMLVRDLLGAEALSGLFLLAYFAAALPGALLAGRLAGRLGAVPVWGASLVLSVLGFGFALSLGPGDVAAFLVICVATGFCLGADLVLPPAILSARIEATATEAAASRAYAVLSFLTKAALALASAVALPALQAAGFSPAATNGPDALRALLLLYAGLPLLLRLAAIAALAAFYRRNAI